MSQEAPKPLLVRLLLFMVAAYCGLAIVTAAYFLPALLVANWGGGPSRSIGLQEIVVGLGVLSAGFGLPSLILSQASRRWTYIGPVIGLVAAALIWPLWAGNPDAPVIAIVLGVMALHGLVLWLTVGGISGAASAPPEWKDMP